jgi:hypothetical protein
MASLLPYVLISSLVVIANIGICSSADAITIRWSPIPPVPAPPFPIPLLAMPAMLDIELRPDQLFRPEPPLPPLCGNPCLLNGINFQVNLNVPLVPGQTFFDLHPGPGFAIQSTDDTTFLNVQTIVPISLQSGTEVDVIQSLGTRNINPFEIGQVQFEAFGSFGIERGVIEPLPEPSTVLLAGTGLVLLTIWLQNRNQLRRYRDPSPSQVVSIQPSRGSSL